MMDKKMLGPHDTQHGSATYIKGCLDDILAQVLEHLCRGERDCV